MNIFFDNNVPAPLRHHLVGHTIKTAWEMGWHELSNGTLLTVAENAGFQLMITGDKNLAYQQNLKSRKISLIVLGSTRWHSLKEDLQPVLGAILRAKPNSYGQLLKPPYVARNKVNP
jgi:hypothetical protein